MSPQTFSSSPSSALPTDIGSLPTACELPGIDDARERQLREATEAGLCLHCGGDLGSVWQPESGPFCCRGCESVYHLIHDSGLARYYELRQGRQAPAATVRSDSFAWLDRLLEEQGRTGSGPPLRLSLDIQGVHCAACIWLLEELFRREEGGLDLRINPTLGKVDLAWDASGGDLRHYLAEVERFGYRLGPSSKEPARRSNALLLRMAAAIAIALNVMMFSISYYFGLAPDDGALYRVFGLLNLALATLAVGIGGQVFFRGALAGLRRRMAHLDLPISVGIVLAYVGSLYGYFTQGPEAAYFDTLTIFIALMLVGRWAQEHILERNRNALLDSAGADRLVVKRQSEGRLDAVPATEIATADELWIAPGDLVPVEGILLRRPARVSLDWITGESDQVDYAPGETVPAGASNAGDHGFPLTALQEFGDSRLNDLLRSEAGAGGSYRPRWWTWVGATYVAAVLSLATIGFVAWAPSDLRLALEVTVAILVVTCPCALGLASPLAQELLHYALRKRGVFLRRPGFMDRALAVQKILLDKTGTLTLGHLKLDLESEDALGQLGPDQCTVLWNMAARSNHPVSRALVVALGGLPVAAHPTFDQDAEEVRELPGQGLEWRHDGVLYRLGRAGFAGDADADRATLFSADGVPLVELRFTEAFKPDASRELERLRRAGYQLHLLSGDAQAKVDAASRTLGVESDRAHGGLDPEQKAAVVRALDENDTLMVGDGLNDSLSFEEALCTATPAVDRPALPGKADFYFLGDGIAALRRALGASVRLRRVVRDNLLLAAAYNFLAVGLCFAGVVTPLVAAVLMPLSSVAIVSLTAWRLTGRRLAWMS
jgi:Cu2+-exporting ATPase